MGRPKGSRNKYKHKINPNDCIALENNRIGIILTQGQLTVIDAVDYNLIKDYCWCAAWYKSTGTFYAVSRIYNEYTKQQNVKLHRILMNVTDPTIFIDHQDHDTLLNTRNNLRIATHTENMHNQKVNKNNLSTGIKNIFRTKTGGFIVEIGFNNGRPVRKTFPTLEAAIEHKTKMLNIYHKEFANAGS